MSSAATVCRLCGLAVRGTDASVVVAGAAVHISCAEAAHSDDPTWQHTDIDALNQLSRGAITGGAVL